MLLIERMLHAMTAAPLLLLKREDFTPHCHLLGEMSKTHLGQQTKDIFSPGGRNMQRKLQVLNNNYSFKCIFQNLPLILRAKFMEMTHSIIAPVLCEIKYAFAEH